MRITEDHLIKHFDASYTNRYKENKEHNNHKYNNKKKREYEDNDHNYASNSYKRLKSPDFTKLI